MKRVDAREIQSNLSVVCYNPMECSVLSFSFSLSYEVSLDFLMNDHVKAAMKGNYDGYNEK